MATSRKHNLDSFEPNDSTGEQDNIIIIGAGPGGLVAALISHLHKNLLKPNTMIILIEKRPEELFAIRPQIVYLNEKVRELLTNYPKAVPQSLDKEDEKFLTTICDPMEHVAIKDVQRFLQKRLANQNCAIAFATTIADIDAENKKITIDVSTSQGHKTLTIPFKYLIIADGGDAENAKKLEEKGLDIKVNKVFDSSHRYMVSAYLTVKRQDGAAFELPHTVLHQLCHNYDCGGSFGYLYYNRSSHVKNNKQFVKFFITFSVPPAYYQEFQKNKTAGLQFLKQCAHDVFDAAIYEIAPVKNSKDNARGHAKDKLKFQLFERTFYKAETAAIEKNGITVARIGNAFETPDFFQGIGLNRAVLQGKDVALLVTGQFSLDEFRRNSELLASEQRAEVVRSESALPLLNANFAPKGVQNPHIKELPFANLALKQLYARLQAWYIELQRRNLSDEDKHLPYDLSLTRGFIEAFEKSPDDLETLSQRLGAIDLVYPEPQFFRTITPTLKLLGDVVSEVSGLKSAVKMELN